MDKALEFNKSFNGLLYTDWEKYLTNIHTIYGY